MVASASFVLLYFQKVLARADPIHVAEVFVVALPLVLLWLIVAAEALDDGLSRAAARLRHASRSRFAIPPRWPSSSSSSPWRRPRSAP